MLLVVAAPNYWLLLERRPADVTGTRMAELSRDHTLKQQLTRSQGLGLSRLLGN